jgi:hypothetical protein
VRRELEAHGYSDWDVMVAGEAFSAERPCADLAFDGAGKTVVLAAGGPR